METSVVRIGNSLGLVLNASLVKKHGLHKGSRVEVEDKGETISVRPIVDASDDLVERYAYHMDADGKFVKGVCTKALGFSELDPMSDEDADKMMKDIIEGRRSSMIPVEL